MLFEIYDTESNGQAYKIERDIIELAERVFCRHDFTLQALKIAWLSRWKDPRVADYQLGRNGVSGDVLTAWHHAEIYQKAREQQPVRSDFLSVHIYQKIQDKLLQMVCEKHIALEVLPTSNVRISYYHSYAEHHTHRWLDDKATYRPVVVMGSDDPGIFATNIFNEYAHVFMSMKDKRVHAHHAINKIRELVGHSQNYGFGG